MTSLSFPDDITILSFLDDEWRAVIAIRGLIGMDRRRGDSEHVAAALRRLAASGKIEKSGKDIGVPQAQRRLGPLRIELYRRRR
jgi:hypothetical protein